MNGSIPNTTEIDGIPVQAWAEYILKKRVGMDVSSDGTVIGRLKDARFYGWPFRYEFSFENDVSGLWNLGKISIDGMNVGDVFDGHVLGRKSSMFFLMHRETVEMLAGQAYMEWCCGDGERP